MLSGKRVAEAVRRGGGLIRPRNAASSVVASSRGVVGAARGFSAAQQAQQQLPKASALPSYVLNCPETQVTTLPNGLRVASEVRPGSVDDVLCARMLLWHACSGACNCTAFAFSLRGIGAFCPSTRVGEDTHTAAHTAVLARWRFWHEEAAPSSQTASV